MRGEFLDLSGARVYYYAAGTRGAGVPVVLIHGFPTSGHLWGEVVPLVPAGHRVVVLDLLGFGRSDPPRDADVSIGGHACRVIELLDVLGIKRACIVGHDMGGGVAQSVAVQHPDRVSHLALVSSVAFDGWPTRAAKLARATLPLTRHLPAEILLSVARRRLLRGYTDKERGTRSLEMYLRPFASADGRRAWVRHLRALDRAESVALSSRLAEIQAPTSIVWGERDPFLPAVLGERLHQRIGGSRIDCIAGARHFTPEEAPRAIADAIAALLEHSAAGMQPA
jgi:2-hydroxymuconate-semialdehyde hydrolase